MQGYWLLLVPDPVKGRERKIGEGKRIFLCVTFVALASGLAPVSNVQVKCALKMA